MSHTELLLIRADACANIGAGHVMRCLALAQAWQAEGGHAVFLSHCESEALCSLLKASGAGFVPLDKPHPDPSDLQKTLALMEEHKGDWVVLDGYHFDPVYQQAIRGAGYRLLVIDDMAHRPEYHADILLNQNINAEALAYVTDPDTRLLLGTRYVLLRPEFLTWRRWRRDIPEVARKVLVTLGGGDPANVTPKVIQALRQVEVVGVEAKIVIGQVNLHLDALRRAVQDTDSRLQLLTTVTDMPTLMAWADVAVSGGGSTCWELAFMSVPAVLLVLAENQHAIAEQLGEKKVAINLKWHEQVTPSQIAQALTHLLVSAEARREMARRGQELVDGDGVERVLMWMRGQEIRLRHVHEEDKQLIWEWANAPDVRAVSFSPEPIPWEQHLQWFKSKLNDSDCVFYVAVNEEEMPVGQIWCEVSGSEAVISVSLDASFRGKGYGSAILAIASRQFYRVSQAKMIHAYVKVDNEASVRTFLKAGFRKVEMTIVHGQEAVHLILPKEEIS